MVEAKTELFQLYILPRQPILVPLLCYIKPAHASQHARLAGWRHCLLAAIATSCCSPQTLKGTSPNHFPPQPTCTSQSSGCSTVPASLLPRSVGSACVAMRQMSNGTDQTQLRSCWRAGGAAPVLASVEHCTMSICDCSN